MTNPLAYTVIQALLHKNQILALAESCTGGMIAAAVTDIPGSSAVFDRGFVTYSNEAKHDMLSVPLDLISKHGAVSADVAYAMAEGVLKNSRASVSLSVTGIAGPSGGSPEKPVGLVYFGLSFNGKTITDKQVFSGDRTHIRKAATEHGLGLILRHV